ncbi:hypothetical protein BDP55DRAFT_699130 [Colletotrichum godetiae]|uniref:Uncharacterized protein n=1 Tax=Colletotrichum godetiae TaxID=1209918 RepID=A0AAJ0A9Y3_9PEZI|nr:uncharacterized protein BDP55DRAFT_699130 [Colletotrichum godetiae]KAK1657190.1 hypothetical protein BDP55DRAFT_699130 [Colletotrichum godetiae]
MMGPAALYATITASMPAQQHKLTMCQYYAHAFMCKHLSFTFARFCQPASLIQKPCAKRQVWQTIGLDDACEECLAWFPDQYPCWRPRYQ